VAFAPAAPRALGVSNEYRVSYEECDSECVPRPHSAAGWRPGLRRAGAYTYLPESMRKFPAPELAEDMRRAGFDAVSYHYLTFGTVALHLGAAREA
jgi:ubiquinone/menaquinone biosynthesis C-methylase UbiE